MDHAAGSVPAADSPQGREKPGWWHTIADLLLAWLATLGVLLLTAVLLSPLKVDLSLLQGDWPWQPTGPWGVVAGAWPALLAGLLFGVALRAVAARRGGWQVRLLPVALLATACFLFSDRVSSADDGGRAAGAWLLIALLVVARQVAYRRALEPLRLSRPQTAAIVGVALAATVATLAYRPLNPLHVQVGATPIGHGVHYGFGDDDERDPRAVAFGLDNAGLGDVRIFSLRAEEEGGGPPAAEIVTQFAAEDFTPATLDGWVPLPAGGMTVENVGSAGLTGRLRLAPGTCSGGNDASVTIGAVVVELETLGLHRTQRVGLPEPVVLACHR